MTVNFIYIIFGIIVIYDIVAVIMQNKKIGKKLGIKTITGIMRRWYYRKPIVPYMVGNVFIGHFYLYQYNPIMSNRASMNTFIILAIISLTWFIFHMARNLGKSMDQYNKFYRILCKYAIIPLTAGAIVGSFWR